ncbi:MAG: hypothetical protein EOP90_06275 [Lysobacteraceae bacterium]|nr:MAG: hypothetical protein EOP90_06275 [Xanthomonadaceae bacterium]
MTRTHARLAWWGALVLALALLKLVGILVDPQIRLFLGDSSSYLFAARAEGWLPSDRSFTYPMLLEALVRPTGSLHALLYWQSLAGILVALLLASVLRLRFDLPGVLAFAAACVFALEPAQLFYERMVLAEAFGMLAFAAFFACASAYLARGRSAWLVLAILFGLATVTLRMNFLPVVIVISLGLPLLLLVERERRARVPAVLRHCALAGLCFWAAHGEYRSYVGTLFDRPPGYIGQAGFMRMGLVAPLITPAHFERVGLPADFAARLAFDLADPGTRPSQLWSPGGLADAIGKAGLDVDATCRKLSAYAVRDDPFGVVRLGVRTLGGYFDPASSRLRLTKDLGRDPMPYPPNVIESVATHWAYDLVGVAERWTPASRAFEQGSRWLVACLFLLVPIALANVLVHWNSPRRVQAVLAALFACGLVASEVLFSSIASYRYLHSLPFFMFVNALPLGVALWQRRPGRIGSRRSEPHAA